jgi:beta-galactosidase
MIHFAIDLPNATGNYFTMNSRSILRNLLGLFLGMLMTTSQAETFSIGPKDFLLDGKPFLIRCGEMHFARIPRADWAQRLRMAHAMGLNTVCAYLFWNVHEPVRGHFDFSGDVDIAAFCRLAQAEGLHVILRPGPYSCAEWDFGGLPWWLLKNPHIQVRTQDPDYMAACKNYLQAVGRELAPLQVTRGGPILMVQVENEYGSFGRDKVYLGRLRDDLKAAGFEVPLFTCDGSQELTNDTRDDLFCVVNLDRRPQQGLKALRAVRPVGPLMIGEYYPGWFDSWGQKHHTGSTTNIVAELGWMLDHNVSFSIYMAHGGTTFGFDAGANYLPPFVPESTSYDYDAPISEAGRPTAKFYALRKLFSQHLNPGESLPDVPPSDPIIQIPPFSLPECAPLLANLPTPHSSRHPKPMELFDQAHGAILYRARLPKGPPATLRCTELNDYAVVFLDGEKIGLMDRRLNQNSVLLPARQARTTLDILVDTFGHVTYGHGMGDRKGITRKVELATAAATNEITGWKIFDFPMDAAELAGLKFRPGTSDRPAFYRGSFTVAQPGDTFLDLSAWSKGMVWVNGHNLGRYWEIGPQQTLYCPGPWLKAGTNEIVVFEFNAIHHGTIAGLNEPILDRVAQ